MNDERIAELIERATEEIQHEREWDSTVSVFNKEKFAKLILREVDEVLRLVPYSNEDVAFGVEVPFRDAIAQHFSNEDD